MNTQQITVGASYLYGHISNGRIVVPSYVTDIPANADSAPFIHGDVFESEKEIRGGYTRAYAIQLMEDATATLNYNGATYYRSRENDHYLGGVVLTPITTTLAEASGSYAFS